MQRNERQVQLIRNAPWRSSALKPKSALCPWQQGMRYRRPITSTLLKNGKASKMFRSFQRFLNFLNQAKKNLEGSLIMQNCAWMGQNPPLDCGWRNHSWILTANDFSTVGAVIDSCLWTFPNDFLTSTGHNWDVLTSWTEASDFWFLSFRVPTVRTPRTAPTFDPVKVRMSMRCRLSTHFLPTQVNEGHLNLNAIFFLECPQTTHRHLNNFHHYFNRF